MNYLFYVCRKLNNMTRKKQNAKNIKAVGANLGPASTESTIDKLAEETVNTVLKAGSEAMEVNLDNELEKVISENKPGITYGPGGFVEPEKDQKKEPNIEDVLREFLLKKAHLFIKDESYGGFVAKLPIGVIKVSDFNKELIFEDLRIGLSDEEIVQFLSARLNLQKEFLQVL